MGRYDRVAAVRFILAIPLGRPFGIFALPDYVFSYIYEHGTLNDLPWIRMMDDDTGMRIRRMWVTDDPGRAGHLALQSHLLTVMDLDVFMRALYREEITVTTFEASLLNYLRTYKTNL